MLDLDDYYYADYSSTNGKANLYIGYYHTAKKAYASHSPTVCYPSQGWTIADEAVYGSITVGPYKIRYEEIVASLGPVKELVLFWYQAGIYQSTQVYQNKIAIGFNKLTKNDEQHAFVRVSVPYTKTSYNQAKKSAIAFIQAFYPNFINFLQIDNNSETVHKNNQ